MKPWYAWNTVYRIKKLYEESYKDLRRLADKNRIERSTQVKAKYSGVSKEGLVLFTVTSATVRGKTYEVSIKLKDLEEAKKLVIDGKPLNTTEQLQLALAGDLEIHCTCPDFKYRFSYLAWTRKFGIFKETRYPKIQNRHLQGSICKHSYAVLKVLPMYFRTIQSDMIKKKILQNPKSRIKPLK